MLTQPQKGDEKVQLPPLALGAQTPPILAGETTGTSLQANQGLPGGGYASLEMGVPTTVQHAQNAEEQLSTVQDDVHDTQMSQRASMQQQW